MKRFRDCVFHVLAHVPATAPASVFDRAYVSFVEAHAGPSSARPLGEDVAVLATALAAHDDLADAQLLAWLWEGEARAHERSLSDMSADDVDDATVLRHLARSPHVAAIEVLRAAAELEADVVAALPPPRSTRSLDRELGVVMAAAPWLARCTVESVRALRLRGRVRGDRIWVGAPCDDLGPTVEHVAWQAAHEATVAEISMHARAASLPYDHHATEHAALVLLHERAGNCGLGDAHARWLAHLGSVPELSRDAVESRHRALLE